MNFIQLNWQHRKSIHVLDVHSGGGSDADGGGVGGEYDVVGCDASSYCGK